MNNISFIDLIKERQIRIPQIQRDYAQGRRNKTVDEIRENFVRSLLLVVMGKKQEVQLDFVYGSERDGAFEPLDGQQRLTTLFLLHWILGIDLKNRDGESCLTYETRNTSKAFCNELILHVAKQFVDEAAAKTKKSKEAVEEEKNKSENELDVTLLTPHTYKISEIIRERDWFQWFWQYDPTICSMLVMIDTICEQMDWSLNLEECQERLQNIRFNYLDLGQLGMSDELFIKMNARGKLLSDFDKLKSTLEEEIQQQQNERDEQGIELANPKIEERWRENMDGKWIDLFWQKYAKDILSTQPENEQLNVAKETERRFRIFLLRMIGIQIFAKLGRVKETAEEKGDDKVISNINKLYDTVYKNNEADLNDLLLAYQNQLTDWRSNSENQIKPDNCITIDFQQLIDYIDLWIIKKDYGYTDVTALLSQEASFNNSHSYFDLFVNDKISNDVTAIIYAMQLFLKSFPYQDSEAWKYNFEEWVRMSRNVFNNDNNTDRFNRRQDLADAFVGIEKMIGDMNQRTLDVNSDKNAILSFIKNLSNNNYKGINNHSLQEEIDKANLRLSDNGEIDEGWTSAIRDAEQDPYLWGQIRCIIYWSEGNLQKFQDYANHLTQWISTSDQEDMQLYYTAMLCFKPDYWKPKNRLYEFNKDRDNSLKRYLQDNPYGDSIKEFIDEWIKWNTNASYKEFCNHIIESSKPDGWVKYLRVCPEIIWEAWRKRVFEDRGHVIFAQQKTTDSHCFDPIFLYLKKWLEKKFDVEMYDSKSTESYGLVINTANNVTYSIRWAEEDSKYTLEKGKEIPKTYELDTLISIIKNELNLKDID